MGLTGLLLKRGAFPPTSLGDSKLGTDRGVLRVANAERQALSGLGKGNEDVCAALSGTSLQQEKLAAIRCEALLLSVPR